MVCVPEGPRTPGPASPSFGEPHAGLPVHEPTGPQPGRLFRICANNSTLDSIQTSLLPHPSIDESNVEGGATNNRHKVPGES